MIDITKINENDIVTGYIYNKEFELHDTKPIKYKYIKELEEKIFLILRNNKIITVKHDNKDIDYLINKFNSFQKRIRDRNKKNPFTEFWVFQYDKPIPESENSEINESDFFKEFTQELKEYDPNDYCYDIYNYSEPFVITKENTEIETFAFFFALALRQKDIFQIDNFLSYQLESNFSNDLNDFTIFLEKTLRKYQKDLFDNEIIETTKVWIENSKNKKNVTNNLSKLKWNGDAIDFFRIFTALVDIRKIETLDGKFNAEYTIMELSKFFGIETTPEKYRQQLSHAINDVSLETNIAIFEKMKKAIQKRNTK